MKPFESTYTRRRNRQFPPLSRGGLIEAMEDALEIKRRFLYSPPFPGGASLKRIGLVYRQEHLCYSPPFPGGASLKPTVMCISLWYE